MGEAQQARGKMRLPPIGFWSYARQDDELSDGELTRLRTQVRSALQQQFGRTPIEIFQDTSAIPHGAKWEEEIRHSLFNSSFLIPILTPNFLQSEWCNREIELFLERQHQLFEAYPDLPRESRIFPIHYVDVNRADVLDPANLKALQELQWFDFRDLRYENGPLPRKAIATFAESIRDLLLIEVARPPTEEELAREARAREERAAAQAARLAAEADAKAKAEAQAEEVRQKRDAARRAAEARDAEAAEARRQAEAEDRKREEEARAAIERERERQALARAEEEEARRLARERRRQEQQENGGNIWLTPPRLIPAGILGVAAVAGLAVMLQPAPPPPANATDATAQTDTPPPGPTPPTPAPKARVKYGWLDGKWGIDGNCRNNWVIIDTSISNVLSVTMAAKPDEPYRYDGTTGTADSIAPIGNDIRFERSNGNVSVTFRENPGEKEVLTRCTDG